MSRKTIRALTLMLVVAVTAAAGMLVWGASIFDADGPANQDTTIVLPRGSSVVQIARSLETHGILEQPDLFRLIVRATGQSKSLCAGEYLVPAGSSMRAVLALLMSGETVVRRFTLPEGVTTVDALALIATAEGLDGAPPIGIGEGGLLPETYHYAYGDARAEVVARMQRAMATLIEELWPARAANLPFDSPAEAIVLASIVEKETGVAEERALVAGVFINRLRRGMRLQSDPTVVYALTQGKGSLGRRLTRADLAVDSPFNTYRVTGLPPAAIANPGRAALEAVLNPTETENLFFVADGTGGHVFAPTLEEHRRNVRRWRKIRSEQN